MAEAIPGSSTRAATSGEVCTCGRAAVLVVIRTDGSEVGYCGLSDGGDQSGPCPFCGYERHLGACPEYRVRAPWRTDA